MSLLIRILYLGFNGLLTSSVASFVHINTGVYKY